MVHFLAADQPPWQSTIPQWVQMGIAVGIVVVTIVTFGMKMAANQQLNFERLLGKIRLLSLRMRNVESAVGMKHKPQIVDEDDSDENDS